MQIYRPEHPNPQFERPRWENLNGVWDFGFERVQTRFRFSENERRAAAIRAKNTYPYKIQVPFCIESALSGIGYTDFVNLVWYRKKVSVRKNGDRVFLHIGAADYLTTVLVNGKCAGRHKGGYTSFAFEVTELLADGENEIFILCEDSVKNPLVMRGKQSEQRRSHGCDYTRTTGIWQTVYLEYVPQSYIESFKVYPNIENNSVTLKVKLCGVGKLACEAFYDGKSVGGAVCENASTTVFVTVHLEERHLWEVGNGRLYALKLTFGEDTVSSYFGLRNVRLDGWKFLLNNKSVFQRLVLDQGFYKKGIYTAESEAEMRRDIELSMGLGFNGARLHQKVFEPRFLYLCDQMGYLVWGEYANWGLDYSSPKAVDTFLQEWAQAVDRDFNHPAIIGWCPFNETWDYHGRQQYDPLLETVYNYTKAVDDTRPCIDTSGNFHVKTDIYDLHDYSFDVAFFRKNYEKLVKTGELYEHVLNDNPGRQKYGGQPVFVSEYGGIKWATDQGFKAWGYGEDVRTEDEFAERYCGLTNVLLQNERMFGLCYTQLYDIEQEQNGLFDYDREKKFSDEIYARIRAVNTQKAAIE